MPDTIYIHNAADGDGPTGVAFARGVQVVYTGTEIHLERDEGGLLAEISWLCGLEFLQDAPAETPFYSVPYLEVFAMDGRGGWFGRTGGDDGPVYHIAAGRVPCLTADSLTDLLDLAVSDPDWRQKRLPGEWPRLPEDPEGRRKLAETLRRPRPAPEKPVESSAPPRLFSSRAEAETEFPIQDIWTVLRQKKTPRFQVHPMMSPRDREGRAFVHYQAWRETYPELMPEDVMEKHTLEHCRALASDRRYASCSNTFVALDREDGDRVVGFGALACRAREFVSVPDAGEIVALYVLREFQGLGLGKELLERCLSWMPRLRTALFVLKGNEKAIGFYRHMGFRFTGRELVENGMTELEMVLERESD